jgi:transposase-like protein
VRSAWSWSTVRSTRRSTRRSRLWPSGWTLAFESLRTWVKRADVDAGRAPGITTAESARIKELERENRELRRANEILKSAASFFARELDPPRR